MNSILCLTTGYEIARTTKLLSELEPFWVFGVPGHRGLLGLAVLHDLPFSARMLMSCPHIHIFGVHVLVTRAGLA